MASSSGAQGSRNAQYRPHQERFALERAVSSLSQRVDSLFPLLNRVRQISGLPQVDFPYALLKPAQGRYLKSYSRGALAPENPLFSTLREAIQALEQNRHLDPALQEIETLYRNYIDEICAAQGKARWRLIKGEARLIGWVHSEEVCLIIPRKEARRIASVDKYDLLAKANTFGASAVFCAGDAFFKRKETNPLRPGDERKANELANLLFGGETPPFLFLTLENVFVRSVLHPSPAQDDLFRRAGRSAAGRSADVLRYFESHPDAKNSYPFEEIRRSYVFQVSKAVPGSSLQSVLDPKSPHCLLDRLLDTISHASFTRGFFLDFFCLPVDAKADNFQVESEIRGIDYDVLWWPPIQNGEVYCRTIRWLLEPFMSLPIDPGYREQLLSINPDALPVDWVAAIRAFNQSNEILRSRNILSQKDFEELSLPTPLSPSVLAYVYTMLKGVQEALRGAEGDKMTPWGLLDRFHPALCRVYQALVAKYPGRPLDAQRALFLNNGFQCYLVKLSDFGIAPEKELHFEPAIGPLEALQSWISTSFETIDQRGQETILQRLFLRFPDLTSLQLSHLKISEAELVRLAQGAQALEELVLSSSCTVSKDCLLTILNNAPRFELVIAEELLTEDELFELAQFAWQHNRSFTLLARGERYQLTSEQAKQGLFERALFSEFFKLARVLTRFRTTVTPDLLKRVVERGNGEALRWVAADYQGLQEVRIGRESLLHHAARANRGDQIAVLHSLGFQAVDLPGFLGRTPLHIAAIEGSVDGARALLDHGANPLLVDEGDGRTALHFAFLQTPNLEMVELLLSRDSREELLRKGDSNGKAPLHLAALQREPRFVEILLGAGADPNAVNEHGYTPLHWAAKNNFLESAQLLLQAGGDPTMVNINRETPFNLALRFNARDVARLLISPGPTNPALPTSSSNPDQAGPSSGSGDPLEAVFALGEASCQLLDEQEHLLAAARLAPAFKLAQNPSIPPSYLTFLELQLDRIGSCFLYDLYNDPKDKITTPSSHTSQIGRHREALRTLRFNAEQAGAIQEQQAILTRGYRETLLELFKESLFLRLNLVTQRGLHDYALPELDQLTPSKYALLALDELSRGEEFPIADLRFAIVVDHPDALPFFQEVAQLVEIKMACLGESQQGFGLRTGGAGWIVGTAIEVAEELGTSLHTTTLTGSQGVATSLRDRFKEIMGWNKWMGEVPGEAKAVARLSVSLDRWSSLVEGASVEESLYRPLEVALGYLQLYFKNGFISRREGIQQLPFHRETKRALLDAFNRASSLVMRSQFARLRGQPFQPDPVEVEAIRRGVAFLYNRIAAFVAHPGKAALQQAFR